MAIRGSHARPTNWPTLPVLGYRPGQEDEAADSGPGASSGTHVQPPPPQPEASSSSHDTWKEIKPTSKLLRAPSLIKRSRTREDVLPGSFPTGDAPPYEPPPPSQVPFPLQDNKQEDDEMLQRALRLSEQEQAQQREEERELQKALQESRQTDISGKGKQPQRSDSLNDEDLQRALKLSAAESASPKGFVIDDLSDEELEQLARYEQYRPGMFDTVDTSSLSIISEQTEQATVASPQGGRTPNLPPNSPPLSEVQRQGDTEPSYFGLWLGNDYQRPSQDVKGHLNNMTFLPPLSEMIRFDPQSTPSEQSHHSRRPLPEVPGASERSDTASTKTVAGSSSNTSSAATRGHHHPVPPPLPPRATEQEPSYRTAPETTREGSNATSSSVQDTDAFHSMSEHDRSNTDPVSSSEGGISRSLGDEPSTEGSSGSPATPEVVWPQHRQEPSNLPAGAHYGVPQHSFTSNVTRPATVRFGFLGDHEHELQPTSINEPFPDVIQLTRSSDVDDYATFGLEAGSFSGLVRFLSLHGDTRIEASPRDIASEKVGTGTTALAASFLRGPDGPCMRLTCHLLPPNSDIDTVPTAPAPPRSTSILRRSKEHKQPQQVSLPDSLTLPVTFSDISAMLLTLRHLAFLAASMPESKHTSGSYSALRSLGLKIAELSADQSRHTSAAKEDASQGRLRDKLKSRFVRK